MGYRETLRKKKKEKKKKKTHYISSFSFYWRERCGKVVAPVTGLPLLLLQACPALWSWARGLLLLGLRDCTSHRAWASQAVTYVTCLGFCQSRFSFRWWAFLTCAQVTDFICQGFIGDKTPVHTLKNNFWDIKYYLHKSLALQLLLSHHRTCLQEWHSHMAKLGRNSGYP
jgi:hypothetical protein